MVGLNRPLSPSIGTLDEFVNIKNQLNSKVDIPMIQTLSPFDVMKNYVQSPELEDNDGNPFFVVDLGEIYRQHLRWKACMPRVEPFYGKI